MASIIVPEVVPSPTEDSDRLRKASEGYGTDRKTVILVLGHRNSKQLKEIREEYKNLYSEALIDRLNSELSGDFRLLVSIMSSFRYDKVSTNLEIAKAEAEKLHDAIKINHLDDDHIILILSTRNLFQLRETFSCYKEFYGNTVEQDIQKSGKGELETLLQLVILCINCPEKHFAKVIRESILGLGTDEDALNRGIVTRAEIDLTKVKSEYVNMYKTTVEDDVIGDTSGDYKDFLLTLLGRGPSGA